MSFLKEFEINNEDVAEGLMWGGLTLPHVMQQKDGSCFSVIEYEPYEKNILTKNLDLPKFRRGWAMWNERQHTMEGDRDFIILFWNPFETKINPAGRKSFERRFFEIFRRGIGKILQRIFQSDASKTAGISRVDEFFVIHAEFGKSGSKNAGSAVVYGRTFIAGREN